MEHAEAARELEERYVEILAEFQVVLTRLGLHDLVIRSLEFVHLPSLRLGGSGCPPGTVPKMRCLPKPGGGVHCFTVCVPAP